MLDPCNRRMIQDAFDAVCRNETPGPAWSNLARWVDAAQSRTSVRSTGTLPLYQPGARPLDARLTTEIRAVLTTQAAGSGGRAVPVADEGPLEAAEAVLTALVPGLWGSARRHIRMVVAVSDAPFKSGSDRRLPGTVFVDAGVFRVPELLSEALLHEGVHQKLYDIYLQAPVLESAYDPDRSPRLRAPWHAASERAPEWPVDNVLAAAHVYAHLTVLRAHQGCEAHDAVGPPYASALSRAVHLTEALRTDRAGRLGPSGAAMVEWLWDGLAAYAGLDTGSAA